MKNKFIASIVLIALCLVASCMPAESQSAPTAQKAQPNDIIDPILAQRKTINPFLAWNTNEGKSGNRYGLAWTADPRRSIYSQREPLIRLSELYWGYYYLNKDWLNYSGIDKFLTKRSWGNGGSNGSKVATDVSSPEFLRYISSIGAENVKTSNAHGLILDWWHDKHQGGFSEGQVRRSRQLLIRELRATLGQNAIIIGNVNWRKDTATVSQINGVFLELAKSPYNSRSNSLYTRSELSNIENLLVYYNKNLAYPGLIALEGWRKTRTVSDADRNTPENRRMAKIMTAMSVVIPSNGYILYGDNNPDTPNGDHGHLYYDFFSFDVGQPTSTYKGVSKGVGFKEHDRGVVAYNITGRDVNFITSDGREITAPANSGLFCEYLGNAEKCLSPD